GVVDDEVRALQERDVALVTRMLGDPARRAPERLVVGDVGDARAVAGHAVGDGGRGVIQVLRLDQHLAHAKESLVELVEVDARASTHEVLPPYRAVCGPGAAIDPRVPQMRASMATCIYHSAHRPPFFSYNS